MRSSKILFASTTLIILFTTVPSFSQAGSFEDFHYTGEINLKGMASSGEDLPFWMYSNKRNRVLPGSNFSTWVTGSVKIDFTLDSFLEIGGGVLYRDGNSEDVIIDQLYAHFENHWFRLTAGRKQRDELYGGLSATNENILWSLNARPLPGLQMGTNGPVYISNDRGLGFEASWNEYLLGEDRYIEEAHLHHKSFHLLYLTANNWRFRAGMQHFAHWGGTTNVVDELLFNQGFMEAVTFKNPSQHHLSSYELSLGKVFQNYRLEFLYNHIAVDLTGRRFGNIPDGRYGIYYEDIEEDKLINSTIYEFYYTHHQNYDSSEFPVDDYFNHFAYQTGWAYKDRIIGVPFFTYNPESQKVINNKFTAHHIGFGGQISTYDKTYPYKLLLSYSHNDGTYTQRFRPKKDIIATYLEARIFSTFVNVNLQIATEFSNVTSPHYGVGVQLKKRF